MTPLGIDDFSAFFSAVHGGKPFPWQERLMDQVATEGWPGLLDLPTGAGKTATLDIAVFHLAMQASRPGVPRHAPRRILMIVDRRIVVDQAHDRARCIASKLEEAKGGIVAEVASALRSLTDTANSQPLAVTVLRGGIYRDPSWAKRPDQPLIVTSTVDQVGSRLLFRGYGVSESMRPVHAGLLTNDALLLLDEVHLSRPFGETLDSLERYRGKGRDGTSWAEIDLPAPWQVVRLSATPGPVGGRTVFRLAPEDRDPQKTPALARRLGAHKPTGTKLVAARGEEEPKRRAFAEACASEARRFVKSGARCVAVVVNRVDTARRVYELLSPASASESLPLTGTASHDRAELLTGRMRPLDRDDVNKRIYERVRAGRERSDADVPVFVVATQCIEAGADYDFDALVTECASLDALRQRFGRLDRFGRYGRATATILARKDHVEADEDPIYGAALRRTWEWLTTRDAWDFGIDHLELPKGDDLLPLLSGSGSSPHMQAPIMLPAHLDAWVQTNPAPAVDPDVALWLHGLDGSPADVQVVWRADIQEDDLISEEQQKVIQNALAACPPSSLEALPVPIQAVRAWLSGAGVADVADVEGQRLGAEDRDAPDTKAVRSALRWRGDDTEVIAPADLRPGDTIVVPASYGGMGRHLNWDPFAKTPFPIDLGDIAQLRHRGRAVLRLHAEVVKGLGLSALPDFLDEATPEELRAQAATWLNDLEASAIAGRPDLSRSADKLISALRSGSNKWRMINGLPTAQGPRSLTLVGRKPVGQDDDLTTEPDVSAFTAAEVPLDDHSRGVSAHAGAFAERCGLPQSLIDDLALAGWLHDTGKADPRFQVWLRGGSAVAVAMGTAPLAKSATSHRDRAARERARALSRYPRGTRHEMLSVALVQGVNELRHKAHDWDLVLHLVASHHGYARPFAPAASDKEPESVTLAHGDAHLQGSTRHDLARLDSGLSDRFWRLTRRYGWFGLAWLEAILRLADHRCSEDETRPGVRR